MLSYKQYPHLILCIFDPICEKIKALHDECHVWRTLVNYVLLFYLSVYILFVFVSRWTLTFRIANVIKISVNVLT